MRYSDGKGTDVRVDTTSPYNAKTWPCLAVNPSMWAWKVIQSYPFDQQQHINVLELRALFNYV
eukprot:4740636-Karenia_brevis.AAC.1